MKDGKPDAKDRKILDVLTKNSRSSIREISKRTGIRPSTVHQRIQRMVEEGVIEKFTVKLNDEMIEQDFVVFMLVSGTMEKYVDARLRNNSKVKEICGLTGEYDLLLKCKFRDISDFNDFIIDFRERYKDHIAKTITMVQTVSLKDSL